MFKNPRRGRQARNFTTNFPKILDLKSSSEQIFFRKLSLGAPVIKPAVDDYQTKFCSLIVEATGTLLKSSLAFVAAVLERVTVHLKVHLNYSFLYDHIAIKQCSMFKQCFLFTD